MSVTTVRLQPELEENLGAMAEKLHRSTSWLINQALREFFERPELEQTRWQETLQDYGVCGARPSRFRRSCKCLASKLGQFQ